MNTSSSRYIRATELLKEYIEKSNDFIEHYSNLYNMMQRYIDEAGYGEKVSINELLLGYTLIDYFEDVRRLMAFHKLESDGVNGIKLFLTPHFGCFAEKLSS